MKQTVEDDKLKDKISVEDKEAITKKHRWSGHPAWEWTQEFSLLLFCKYFIALFWFKLWYIVIVIAQIVMCIFQVTFTYD